MTEEKNIDYDLTDTIIFDHIIIKNDQNEILVNKRGVNNKEQNERKITQ